MAETSVESVQQTFERFEREVVRVPKAQNDAAKETHPLVRHTLEVELPDYVESFLSGSYGRRVQAVRLKDVDIIVVLDDPTGEFAASADAALDAVRKAAAKSNLVRRTEKRIRSVRLQLHDHEFTIDLVAALKPPGGENGLLLARRLPDEGLDDWTLADPRGQLQAAITKNERCDGMYVPCVRIVKYWLGTIWGDGHKAFRSYHAESVLHWALATRLDYSEAIVRFFDAAYDALAPGAFTPDPGAPWTYVDERLDYEERREAREKVARARDAAHAAQAAPDLGQALDAWAGIFGSAFPAPSTSPDKVAEALGARTAGIVGAGVRPGAGRRPIESRPWRP